MLGKKILRAQVVGLQGMGEPKDPKQLVVQTIPLFKRTWMWIIAGCHVPALFIA
jgi:hypothetical protein